MIGLSSFNFTYQFIALNIITPDTSKAYHYWKVIKILSNHYTWPSVSLWARFPQTSPSLEAPHQPILPVASSTIHESPSSCLPFASEEQESCLIWDLSLVFAGRLWLPWRPGSSWLSSGLNTISSRFATSPSRVCSSAGWPLSVSEDLNLSSGSFSEDYQAFPPLPLSICNLSFYRAERHWQLTGSLAGQWWA